MIDDQLPERQELAAIESGVELDKAGDEDAEIASDDRSVATALFILLETMSSYFSGRVDADDIDALSFSLRHIFGRADYLFRLALPAVMEIDATPDDEQPFTGVILRHQHFWTHLRAARFALNRLESLCHLLNHAAESLLDTLDVTAAAPTIETDDTIPRLAFPDDDPAWQPSLDQERWEQALATLLTSLSEWHESYGRLVPFSAQFAQIVPALPTLPVLDETFSVLLDCAGAIFGDIVPGFQAISINDDEAVCVLLLDLMQQSDQLQAQFDRAIEPLHALIEHFAPGIGHS